LKNKTMKKEINYLVASFIGKVIYAYIPCKTLKDAMEIKKQCRFKSKIVKRTTTYKFVK